MSVGSLTLSAASRRRLTRARLLNRIFTIALWSLGILAMLPLFFIAGFVLAKGASHLNFNLFTKTPAVPGAPGGGISQAFVGSGLIVGMSVIFSVILGLGAAIYISEFGSTRAASVIRFTGDVLLSTPSIVAGFLVWTLIIAHWFPYSALAGSIAISLLIWPIVARASEDILRLVPRELRDAGAALGAPKWKVVVRVVIPAASAGLANAVLLAVARGIGETAPVLLTILGSDYISVNPTHPSDTISLRIYNYARSPVSSLHDIAWAASLSLLIIVLLLSLTARYLGARTRKAMA
ncbi:MAG TPA: phosphate ABC transporter permease PstA [Actinomycetota bacterium]|nr:phosphate ABC transporter permease PstA [Actinomycetota bacterium]